MNVNCFHCGFNFELKQFIFHLKTLKTSRYACTICNSSFDYIHNFLKHVKRHESSKKVTVNSSLNNNECFSEFFENSLEENSYEVIISQNETHNTDSYVSELTKHMLNYYCKATIPRKYSMQCIQSFSLFIKKFITDNMSNDSFHNSGPIQKFLKVDIPTTEYKFIKYLKQLKCFFKCRQVAVNRGVESSLNIINIPHSKEVVHSLQIFPLKDFFSKLFTSTSFLKEMTQNIDIAVNSEYIRQFSQSPFFKEKLQKIRNDDKSLHLPLIIFFDDFEVNNPLGSRAGIQKIGGVYAKIPCLPPRVQSKMSFIFLCMLFYTEDRKLLGNERIFSPLINELNSLSNHAFRIENFKYNKVFLVPSLFVGDNLGVNSALGFSESFSANYYCRFCTAHRHDTEKMYKLPENLEFLDFEFYSNFIRDPNHSSPSSIKENSIWNNLNNFHVSSNYAVDIMHDLLEGVCHYDMLLLLGLFINKYKYFSLEELNFRILAFSFDLSVKNKPPLFNSDQLKKSKIKMSASEMLTFIRNFSLLVGDKVPENSKEWKLYLYLREIIDCCFSESVHVELYKYLKYVIERHNFLYAHISNNKLTPKFHFLLHYPYIMSKIGPLKTISSLRFETFHQNFKKIAYSTNCKINIIESLTSKDDVVMFDKLETVVNSNYKC
ncbi:uncharacterized protein LOC142225001 [Haematobia irritans]|uniref:uncharacterized protein LOC142225001 n=1 Tax=Haematobia irritans TaxID=7368 RepID=UPI003F501389